MHRLKALSTLLVSAGVGFLAGCSSPSASAPPAQTVRIADANTPEIVAAAQIVLDRMRFDVEKADPDAGMVRTAPLPAAQFFELWRSDNVRFSDVAAANLHSIRRSVELTVSPDRGQSLVHCVVRVQRLSLPGHAVSSVSQAYRIHSHSDPDLQTFVLTPGQRAAMAWIDLGDDAPLAEEILKRIERQLAQQRGEEGVS
jgi:hypothetical protein